MVRLTPFLLILFSLPVEAGELCRCRYKDGSTGICSPGQQPRGAKLIKCVGTPGRASSGPSTKRAGPPKTGTARKAKKNRGPSTSQALRERARRYAVFVRKAAETYSLPEALIWAVMHTESRFKPEVVSHKGACGLMQLLPGTAKEMGVEEIFDPEQNIMGGTRYLRLLANRFSGDTVKMIAGYHAGGGAVSAANGIPYEKTGEYLRRVLNAYYAYQKKLPTEGP